MWGMVLGTDCTHNAGSVMSDSHGAQARSVRMTCARVLISFQIGICGACFRVALCASAVVMDVKACGIPRRGAHSDSGGKFPNGKFPNGMEVRGKADRAIEKNPRFFGCKKYGKPTYKHSTPTAHASDGQ